MPKRKVDVELLERLYKHRMMAADLLEELEAILGKTLPVQAEDKLLELIGHLRFSCPLHPDAQHDDFDEDRGRGCLICLSYMRPGSDVLVEKRHELEEASAVRTSSERALTFDADTSFAPWGSEPEVAAPSPEPLVVVAPPPPKPAPAPPSKAKMPPAPSKPLVLGKPRQSMAKPPPPPKEPFTSGMTRTPHGNIRYADGKILASDDPIVTDMRSRICAECWKTEKNNPKYTFMGRFNSPKGAECSVCKKHMMLGAMVKERSDKKPEGTPP